MVDVSRVRGLRIESRAMETALRFDYTSVSFSVSKFLQAHGSFIGWVETEACIPARTAQVYMRVAHWVSDKGAAAALLPPGVLHLLSAPSVPKDFVCDILNRVDAGEHVVPTVVRRQMRALRDAKHGQHHQEVMTSQSADSSQKTEMNTTLTDANDVVTLAVAIMAHGLSLADFEQVRALLTSKQVLDDHKLAYHLVTELLRVGSIAQTSCGRRRQCRVAHE
jgi:hypothetical protein